MPSMHYTKLGWTDLSVSVIALGCAQFSEQFSKTQKSEADMLAILRRALDLGINLWDTAPSYGNGVSETIVGKAIQGCRDQVVLATKIKYGHTTPEAVERSCEESLRRLHTDYIDVLQVHWPAEQVLNEQTLIGLWRLVQTGKVRYAGVSNFNQDQMEQAASICPIISNQLPYALVWRYDEPLIRYCGASRKIGVLAYSPLGEGILTGRYDEQTIFPPHDVRNHCVFFKPAVRPLALKVTDAARQVGERYGLTPAQVAITWTAHQPGISSVIVGSSSVPQLEQNAAAVSIQMDKEDEALLAAASDEYMAKAPRYRTMWEK